MSTWQVHVQAIGVVHESESEYLARRIYEAYAEMSSTARFSRVAGAAVALRCDGQLVAGRFVSQEKEVG